MNWLIWMTNSTWNEMRLRTTDRLDKSTWNFLQVFTLSYILSMTTLVRQCCHHQSSLFPLPMQSKTSVFVKTTEPFDVLVPASQMLNSFVQLKHGDSSLILPHRMALHKWKKYKETLWGLRWPFIAESSCKSVTVLTCCICQVKSDKILHVRSFP